jgi:hypothetical protein
LIHNRIDTQWFYSSQTDFTLNNLSIPLIHILKLQFNLFDSQWNCSWISFYIMRSFKDQQLHPIGYIKKCCVIPMCCQLKHLVSSYPFIKINWWPNILCFPIEVEVTKYWFPMEPQFLNIIPQKILSIERSC